MLHRSWVFSIALPLCLAGCGQPSIPPDTSSENPATPGLASGPSSRTREAWNPINAPSRLEWNVERNFSRLPIKAQTKLVPWSDTYWPSFEGGIAWRWQSSTGGEGDSFGYRLRTKEQLLAMTPSDISVLSPAEKYDILMGRYDYPLVQQEWRRTDPKAPSWEGICHGWAHAAVNFSEPVPVTMKNPDGISVSFGSSDVKALLSYYQGEGFTPSPPQRYLGARCNFNLKDNPEFGTLDACRDANPGSFHILLAHYVHTLGTPLVADIVRDEEVWNHPIYAYRSQIMDTQAPSQDAAPGTAREIVVSTRIEFIREGSPRWRPNIGTGFNLEDSEVFRYRLELDADDNIVGGAWESDARPDFLWIHNRPVFNGYYAKLGDLYARATTAGGN